MSLKIKAYYFLIGFICINILSVKSQNNKLADSLIIQFESGDFQLSELDLLKSISENVMDPDKRLLYADLLIQKSSPDSIFNYLISGFAQKGNAYLYKGDFEKSLASYFKALNYASRTKDVKKIGMLTISIADTYSQVGNASNAEKYYNSGIELLRTANDSIALATALLNAGDEAFNNKKFETAINYFDESGQIFKKINYLTGTAYNLGNIGMVYAERGENELALKNINQAINILEDLSDYNAISVYLTYMSDIYLIKNELETAIEYSSKSLELAKLYGLKDQISQANLQLSDLHEKKGNLKDSYSYYKDYIIYRDSLANLETIQTMADLRTDNEVSQKQSEITLLNQQKRNQLIILGFTGFLLLTLFWFYRSISKEKKRSENLLLNILPEETAEELKKNGKVIAKKYDSVSVLFTDFKGFTHFAESLSPEELVASVDYYFSKFDAIIEKHGLEKIKTIGDAYMCAGGLNNEMPDHALTLCKAAFEINEFVKQAKNSDHAHHTRFDIRLGISSGPVVAGVVGTKKFAYDIWGDTVNVASRMESMSEVGRINISQKTYQLIKEQIICEPRGEIEVKNKGKLKMYFLTHIKDFNPIIKDQQPELSLL